MTDHPCTCILIPRWDEVVGHVTPQVAVIDPTCPQHESNDQNNLDMAG
jgi:hypothetical protein